MLRHFLVAMIVMISNLVAYSITTALEQLDQHFTSLDDGMIK